MNKKVLLLVLLISILLLTSCIISNVIASKLTCKHESEYEIEILPYKAATCQEEGLTQGKKCTYCGKILVEQKTIDKITCKESDWIVDIEPTLTKDGAHHTQCTMCGKTMKQQIIGAGTQGLEYRQNNDGTYTLEGDGNSWDTEIVIPSIYNGQKVTSIGAHAFMGGRPNSVIIPNTVKTIGAYAFTNCSKLSNIIIPNGVKSIGYYCFKECTALRNISIPNSVTLIDHSAFWGCSNLRTVNLPSSGTIIGAYAFKGCTALESIDIPDGMTEIGNATFFNCSSLTSVTIPNTVTNIIAEAFYGCTSLTTINFEGTVEQWNAIKFGNGWSAKVPATEVICSDGMVSLK